MLSVKYLQLPHTLGRPPGNRTPFSCLKGKYIYQYVNGLYGISQGLQPKYLLCRDSGGTLHLTALRDWYSLWDLNP